MPDQPNPSPYRSEPFRSYSRRVAHDLCEVPDLARIALAAVGLLSTLQPHVAKEWPNTTEDDIPTPAFPTQLPQGPPPKTMKAMTAIKKYFEMSAQEAASETKRMSHEDRQELGALACVELGETFEPSDPPKRK